PPPRPRRQQDGCSRAGPRDDVACLRHGAPHHRLLAVRGRMELSVRAWMLSTMAAAALLSLGSPARAEPVDSRGDAVNRILPGEGVRVHSMDGTVEGTFVTNRSDSVLLRQAAQRVSISYHDIQRLEVSRSARSHGMVIGMIIGGVALGAAAA